MIVRIVQLSDGPCAKIEGIQSASFFAFVSPHSRVIGRNSLTFIMVGVPSQSRCFGCARAFRRARLMKPVLVGLPLTDVLTGLAIDLASFVLVGGASFGSASLYFFFGLSSASSFVSVDLGRLFSFSSMTSSKEKSSEPRLRFAALIPSSCRSGRSGFLVRWEEVVVGSLTRLPVSTGLPVVADVSPAQTRRIVGVSMGLHFCAASGLVNDRV